MNLLIYLFNIIVGCSGALLVLKFGNRFGLVDLPNERSSHFNPTPKGGAIGILIGFLVTAVYLELSCGLLLPAVFLSLISFLGDRYEIAPTVRLTIQLSCGMVFLGCFFYEKNTHFLMYCLVFPLAVYIAGTANFYNFMDGINGIASIAGIVGFILLAVFGIVSCADSKYVKVCVAIVCACVGFLPYNIPKAKVFMGDVGSILLGFIFACLVVVFSKSLLDFICLAGCLFPFYVDELMTMWIRIKDGEALSKPHRRHLYQLLANEYGIDHWKISVGYGAIQLIIGLGLIIFRTNWNVVLAILSLSLLAFVAVSALVRQAIEGKVVTE